MRNAATPTWLVIGLGLFTVATLMWLLFPLLSEGGASAQQVVPQGLFSRFTAEYSSARDPDRIVALRLAILRELSGKSIKDIELELLQPVPTPSPTPSIPPVGRIEITHPIEMIVGESDRVTLEIISDPQFSGVGEHPPFASGVFTIESISESGKRIRREFLIRIYGVMQAELIAPDFEIDDVSEQSPGPGRRRFLTLQHTAAWSWIITPKRKGNHQIAFEIYGRMDRADEEFWELEISRDYTISVRNKPLIERGEELLSRNPEICLGAGGVPALILLIVAILRRRQDGLIQLSRESLGT